MNTIKLDYDGAGMKKTELDRRMKRLLHILKCEQGTATIREFKTARGRHLYINIYHDALQKFFGRKETMDAFKTMIVQLYLGSDPERELLNFERVMNGTHTIDESNVLFKKKYKQGRLISEERFTREWSVKA